LSTASSKTNINSVEALYSTIITEKSERFTVLKASRPCPARPSDKVGCQYGKGLGSEEMKLAVSSVCLWAEFCFVWMAEL
jgi:hypothetical protein